MAGYCYPRGAQTLRQVVTTWSRTEQAAQPALAVVVPHGSYSRAGRVLGETLARVTIPRRCIVVGASHGGSWMRWSLMTAGAYRTPLGDVPVDAACAQALRARCPFLEPDAWVQQGEHAIEVLVPFLQVLGPEDLSLVPILVGSDEPAEFAQLGEALAQVVRMLEEPVLLIASSDLAHYEPVGRTCLQDAALLGAVCALDGEALRGYVQSEGMLMCGYGAVISLLEAAKALGAREVIVTAHTTSAEADGDPDSAVGYGGCVIR